MEINLSTRNTQTSSNYSIPGANTPREYYGMVASSIYNAAMSFFGWQQTPSQQIPRVAVEEPEEIRISNDASSASEKTHSMKDESDLPMYLFLTRVKMTPMMDHPVEMRDRNDYELYLRDMDLERLGGNGYSTK